MKPDEKIIKVFSSVNPAEIAVLENRFLESDIEYQVNDDTNYLTGFSTQHVYIRSSDLVAARTVIAGLKGDDGEAMDVSGDEQRPEHPMAAVRAPDSERAAMVRRLLLSIALFAGGSLLYGLLQYLKLF